MLLSYLLSDIIDSLDFDLEVSGIASDLACHLPNFGVQPGYLFCVITPISLCEFCEYPYHQGKRADIVQAIKSGAAAVLVHDEETKSNVEWLSIDSNKSIPVLRIKNLQYKLSAISAKFCGGPSTHLRTVAVTGTNGKTSICHLTSQALNLLGQKCGVIGTLGHGLRGQYFDRINTTPHAHIFQQLLWKLCQIGCDSVALEATSIGLDMGRLEAVDVEFAIFTNFSQDHLDFHGTMEKYASAKRRLFYWKSLKYVILNVDCPFGQQLIVELAAKRDNLDIFALTLDENSIELPLGVKIIKATNYHCSLAGIRVTVGTPWGQGTMMCPHLIGLGNVFNVIAVLTVCKLMGHDFDQILTVLSQLEPVPGRMEIVPGPVDKPTVVVDFAHCAGGLEKALESLKSLPHHQLWCVFGCGGERDKLKRPLMAKAVCSYADRIIVTDDNPRFEDSDAIFEQISKGLEKSVPTTFEHDRRKALELAINEAKSDDIILIAGRGGEETQIVKGVEIPFNDSVVVKEILENVE